VLTRTEVLEHPQVQANELLVCYDHPQAGQIRQARAPARFSRSPGQPWHGAPAIGQHTVALLEDCGYSGEEVEAMVRSGAAGAAEPE
jgi:crotonobetainyl-CoA:carnitine CoA-transferase CaiB-like acyl-CoA transferase